MTPGEAYSLRRGLGCVFHRETHIVSQSRYVATGITKSCALGGHLRKLRSSEHLHLHGIQGRVCLRTGRDARNLRGGSNGVLWLGKLRCLRPPHTTSRCQSGIFEGVAPTAGDSNSVCKVTCNSNLDACWRGCDVTTVEFCWILMTRTAACCQADTSDSDNKLCSQFSVLTCGKEVRATLRTE
jgi:hypothetical protein